MEDALQALRVAVARLEERLHETEHIREILALRLAEADKALRLQATETARRLDALNHEADQLKRMQSTYLPRELYETAHKELNVRLDMVQKIVYVGIGGLLALEFALKYFWK